MQRHCLRPRILPSAWVGVVCLLLGGCVTSSKESQPGAATPRSPQPPAAKATTSPDVSADALAHYAAGVSLELREGGAAALPEFEKAYELDPTNAALAGRIAQILITQQNREKAIEFLNKALKATPNAPEPWFWLGIARRSGDEFPQAIEALQQALKVKPDYLPAVRALVEVYLQKDAANEVPPLLERAFKQTSKDATFWVGLGDLYSFILKQRPSLASQIPSRCPADCFQKAREITPRDPEILLRVAEAEMAVGNFTAAADAYGELLKLRPDLTQLRERLALAYLRADQRDKAIVAFLDILKREPLRYDIHNTLAELYQENNKDAEAATHLQRSIQLNPNQFEVYVRLALAQLRMKRYEDALENLAAARTRFPQRFQIPYLNGLVFSEQKQFDKAMAAFADAEQLLLGSEEDKPTSPFYFMYASACLENKQTDKAVLLYRKALELDPKNHAAANALGYLWADNNQNLQEALDLINKAVAAQPENPAYLDSLGWVYYRLGRLEDALKQLRRSAELLKEPDAVVFDHLAEVLDKLGRRDEAIASLKKALQADPKNKELAEKLQRWTKK